MAYRPRRLPWFYHLLAPLSVVLIVLGFLCALAAISTFFFMTRHNSGLPAILMFVFGILSCLCFAGSYNCSRYKRHLEQYGYW